MGSIGPMEIGLLIVLAVMLFGAKRLPEIGRSLGTGMREFKHSVGGITDAATAPVSDRLPSSETVSHVEDVS